MTAFSCWWRSTNWWLWTCAILSCSNAKGTRQIRPALQPLYLKWLYSSELKWTCTKNVYSLAIIPQLTQAQFVCYNSCNFFINFTSIQTHKYTIAVTMAMMRRRGRGRWWGWGWGGWCRRGGSESRLPVTSAFHPVSYICTIDCGGDGSPNRLFFWGQQRNPRIQLSMTSDVTNISSSFIHGNNIAQYNLTHTHSYSAAFDTNWVAWIAYWPSS